MCEDRIGWRQWLKTGSTVQDHTAEMVDRDTTVVRVERVGLLEVEDEVGQVDE